MAYEHVSLLNNKSKYLYSGGRSVDICPPKNIMSDKNLTSSLTYPENLKICDHGQHDHSNKASSSSDSKNPFYEVSNEYMRLSGYARQFTKLLQKNCKRKCENIEMPPPTIIDMTPEINDPDPDCQDLSKNVGSPYGILWKNPPNFKRIKRRKQLFLLKTKACYMAVLFSLIGLICAILEAELIANQYTTKHHYFSHFLRTIIVLTTLILMSLIAWYHIIEIQITIIDSGACDWQVTVTSQRIVQLSIELLVCSISPFPNHIDITWLVFFDQNHRQVRNVVVPLDSLLILPMFLRCYLFCRFMALRSRQFQDAATRSIASLNRVAVDFKFVLKTMMFEHPLRVLCTFTLTFWIVTAWIFMHCERQSAIKEDNAYLNSIWFIMITFKSIGYGDIVPNTYCGRVLAITAGIVGAAVSSALIAVISHKLELSRAEKHVNNFMADSKLTRMRKHTAAMVLQHTWFIHKYSELGTTKDEMKLRFHQRRFLAAINEFRKVKWDQRKLAEQGNALIDLAKLQNDTYTMIYRMQQSLEKLTNQIDSMRRNFDHNQRRTPTNRRSENCRQNDRYC